jgi:hypothetical protein
VESELYFCKLFTQALLLESLSTQDMSKMLWADLQEQSDGLLLLPLGLMKLSLEKLAE